MHKTISAIIHFLSGAILLPLNAPPGKLYIKTTLLAHYRIEKYVSTSNELYRIIRGAVNVI